MPQPFYMKPAAPQMATPAAPQMATPAAPQMATPAAQPMAIPAAPQMATPAAQPMATPAAPQMATPAAQPMATPAAPQMATPAAPQMATPSEGYDAKIQNVHGNGVVLDIREALNRPNGKSARIFGEQYHSVFQLRICNYKETPSVTVSYNLTPEVVVSIYKAAERYAFTSDSESPAKTSVKLEKPVDEALAELYAALSTMPESEVRAKIADAYTKLYNARNTDTGNAATSATEFLYTANKVNPHKKGADGFAPVSQINISRAGMRGTEKARYPWTVTITTSEAPLVTDGGKTTYNGRAARNQKKASIFVSDADMLALTWEATAYLSSWLTAFVTPSIKAATKMKEEKRND